MEFSSEKVKKIIEQFIIDSLFSRLPSTYNKYSVEFRKIISSYLTKEFGKTLTYKTRLYKNEYEKDGKPTIYSGTHVFFDDIAAICSLIDDNMYLVSDDDTKNCIGFLEGIALYFNGVIFFEKSDKTAKKIATEQMIKVLKNGGNILIFPESTWNFRSNMPIRDELPWGLLNIAETTNANVVPVAINLVGDEYLVNVGKKLDITSDKKIDILKLTDEMATLVWELYELKEPLKRSEVGPDEIDWYNYIQEKCSGQYYDFVKEEACAFRPEGKISLDEVIAEMFGMEYRSIASDYETYKKIRKLSDGFSRINR